MSVRQYTSEAFIKVLNTGESVFLGGLNPSVAQELTYIRLMVQITGTVTNEKFRISLYGTSDGDSLRGQSDVFSLSEITTLSTTNWLGWLRFDFSGIQLHPSYTYYPRLEPVTYTRNGDTFYMAVELDWPNTWNTQSDATLPSARMEVYGSR